MSIDNSIVRKVGKLAKIKIKESEENKLLDDVSKLVLSADAKFASKTVLNSPKW